MTRCIYKISIIMLLNVMFGALFASNTYAEVNASKVVGSLVQMMDANCKRKYSESSIRKTIYSFPEYRRKLMRVNLEVRKTAECQCMPEKLRNLSDERLSQLQEKDFKKSLHQMLGTMTMNCLAAGYRKQWVPLCHAIMLPETDDQKKITEACQCMNKEVQNINNDDLMLLADNAKKYTNAISGEAGEKNRKVDIEKTLEACAAKAGIEEDSDYKKKFKMAREDDNRIILAKIRMKSISLALDRYRLDNYKYPGQQQGLAVLTVKSSKKNSSPYIQKLGKDPWGNAYIYRVQDNGNSFELLSYGRDKKPEGSGSDEDIYHNR